MMALLTYSLCAGIFLLFGYMAFGLFIADLKQPRFNRALLWGIMVMSLALPFVPALQMPSEVILPFGGHIEIGLPHQIASETGKAVLDSYRILPAAYMAGACMVICYMAFSMIRLVHIIRTGKRETMDDGILIVYAEEKLAPFSWMHYIILNKEDNADDNRLIIMHEKAHISRLHSLDIVLATILCAIFWYNPAAWLWRKQLAMAHEYEADSRVMDSGIDVRQYQTLLIKKAVGSRLQSLANNLTHSKLKKRISMMCRKQNRGASLLCTLAIVPAIAGALAVVNIPAVASVVGIHSPQSETVSEVSKKTPAVQSSASKAAEDKSVVNPSYPGGDMAMMQFLMNNVRYPEAAYKADVQGRVLVQFKVKTDGTISDVRVKEPVNPDLDAEAVRVVSMMPKFNPGKENGKVVESYMQIPIEFKLQEKDDNED